MCLDIYNFKKDVPELFLWNIYSHSLAKVENKHNVYVSKGSIFKYSSELYTCNGKFSKFWWLNAGHFKGYRLYNFVISIGIDVIKCLF